MGRRLNMVLLAAIAMASMLQSSSAQTAYVVGDSLGWVVPPGGATAYTTWAANKTFSVGDTLVFNFINGSHNVGKVTKANFDGCNTGNTILLLSNSPANVTLNETGEHYFLCAFPGHCAAGQKLAVNVTAATSSPAPQPSSPPPQPSSPAPQPSTPPPQPSSPAPQPSTAPASPPQITSPSPTPAPSSPTASPPSSSPSSPAPPTATPPSPSPTTTPSGPTSPSPTGDNGVTPPAPGNSATSLGVATGLSAILLSLIVAFFM